MKHVNILYLQDSALDAQLITKVLLASGMHVDVVDNEHDFECFLKRKSHDVIMSDHSVAKNSSVSAIHKAKSVVPSTPVICLSGTYDDTDKSNVLAAGAFDYISKEELELLVPTIKNALNNVNKAASVAPLAELSDKSSFLIETIQQLSECKSIDDVAAIVRHAARLLVGADGATFVLQERGRCYYADEEAIAPLWKGMRFPMETCISGWCMLNKQQVVIDDIYEDPRIPHEAYRPTFVKSLIMTPVRKSDPMAAIGTYWAEHHVAGAEERKVLQTLADTTAVVLANVSLFNELEQRVLERTRQLEIANSELESFAYTISHDLKGPLRAIQRVCEVYDFGVMSDANKRVLHMVGSEAKQLADLTEALLKLCQFSFVEPQRDTVDITNDAKLIFSNLSILEPGRQVKFKVQPNIFVKGDRGLLHSVLENLIGNAWKYTGKESEPIIEIGIHEQTPSTCTIFIRDNGVGFDMSKASKLFEPFYRIHTDSDFAGTGVGLATVRRIVGRHGGKVWVQSQPGQGSTFYVMLPASD